METTKKSEIQKIKATLRTYVALWNDHDMDSWGRLFAENVDYINRNGGWWKNNEENIEGHRRIHNTLKEMGQPNTFRLKIQKIEFLQPEVAVVQASSDWPGFKPQNPGEPIKNLQGIMTCVFIKVEEKWLIKTLHNTLRS